MFPEGTTSANPPNLVSFKNGPFKLAIDQHVPIVPITFMDNWKLFHYDLGFYGKPGLTRTVIHEPIDTKQMTSDDVPLLKERVYSIIESTLKEEYESQFKIS